MAMKRGVGSGVNPIEMGARIGQQRQHHVADSGEAYTCNLLHGITFLFKEAATD